MIAPRDAARPVVSSAPAPRSVPEIGWTPALFRRAAGRFPDLIALEGTAGAITYGALDAGSDHLADRLRAMGVGRGVLVGMVLPRSVDLVSTMLGIQKAGGAFLPINPDDPTKRKASLLFDAHPSIIVTTSDLAGELPEIGARILELDRVTRSSARPAVSSPTGTPDDLAYAIFTSGSTGSPKAALLTHRGIGTLARAQAKAFGIGPGTRVLQFASPTFDAMISEVFVTLLSGGTLCLADREDLIPGPRLSRTIRDRRIAVATLPPTVVSLLEKGEYPELRTLVVAGEECSARLATEWSVGRRLINAYGPTEATVCASLFVCPEGPQPRPPIGHPLPHVETIVLDESGDPVPEGEDGELCLGGPALAEGYLNRPRLTAERFVSHPFETDPDRRLYRTGDRVRKRTDGILEFLGRCDEQVKIRGVRIEPAEVREAIERHPGVRASAVIPEGEGGARRLSAFVVSEGDDAPSPAELREHLRALLPIHLIPSRILLVDRLPTTSHGKLDPKALRPNTATTRPIAEAHEGRLDARDATELALARIWHDLFGREVGIHDDFFELGGDSLRVMDLLARIQERSGAVISIGQLMARPTVAGIAEVIAGRRTTEQWSPLVPIQAEGCLPPLFCIHPGGGNVLCYVELSRSLGPDQPFFGVQAPGVDEGRSPLTSVEELAELYLDAISTIQPVGPLRLCGWSFGGVVAYEMARRLADRGEPPDRLVLIDAGFLHSFAVLRALIPSEKPLVQFLGAAREAIFPEFHRHAERSGIVPPGATEAQIHRIFDVFMANVEALTSYRPGPYSGGPITLLMAEERMTDRRRDPVDEWRLLSDELDVVRVPGNHLTMLRRPHVAALASVFADRLAPPVPSRGNS